MNEEPYQPGQESFEKTFWKVHHSLVFRDDRHASFIEIRKRFHLGTLFKPYKVFAKQFALLYGYLCKLRMTIGIFWISSLVTHVTDGENVRTSFYPIEFIH